MITPLVDTFSMRFSPVELPIVDVTVCVDFSPSPFSHIVLPLTFIPPSTLIDHVPFSMPLSLFLHLTTVDRVPELEYREVGTLFQLCE